MEGHRAWIALNLEHLRHNVAALQALLPPGCRLMPVVKANAYGHGAVPIAQALSRRRRRERSCGGITSRETF